MTQALLMQVRGMTCAVPITAVVEVMRPPVLQPIEGMAPGIVGVAVVRGQAVPVVDLGAVLVGGSSPPAQRLVIVRVEGRTVALAVEHVQGVGRPDEADWAGLPPLLQGAARDAVAGLAVRDQGLLALLSATRLLTDAQADNARPA